jgi:hypothetical protein
MTHLNYYLTEDHAARQRTMLFSVATGAAVGMITQGWGIPFNTSVLMCVLATGAVELTSAMLYAPRARRTARPGAALSSNRRDLLRTAFSAACFLVMVRLGARNAATRAEEALNLAEQEAKAGRTDKAAMYLQRSVLLLRAAAFARVPAPESFFPSAVNTLDQLRSTGLGDTEIHQASLRLAAYRSAINPTPSLPKQTGEWPNTQPPFTVRGVLLHSLTTVDLSPGGKLKPIEILGPLSAIDCRGMKPDQEIFTTVPRSLDQNPVTVKGFILIGATQTLDYINWEDVTFVGTHIKYLGDPVRLRNMRFVNCTFDFPVNEVGTQFARYVALEPKEELRVG